MTIRRRSLLSATAAGVALAAIGGVPATAATPHAHGTYFSFTNRGVTSQYHVYAKGVVWTKRVGVVFYFDGDHRTKKNSRIHNPSHPDMLKMAEHANWRNMIMVAVVSPDKDASGEGMTWWEDIDRNGDWFRALAQNLIAKHGLDATRLWFCGYSGGAEFISYEVFSDRQSWIKGGGAVIIGGGGSYGLETAAPTAVKRIPMRWVVGNKDKVGATSPPTWSASAAAAEGAQAYRKAGFTKTRTITISGDHLAYDIPKLLENALNDNGVGRV